MKDQELQIINKIKFQGQLNSKLNLDISTNKGVITFNTEYIHNYFNNDVLPKYFSIKDIYNLLVITKKIDMRVTTYSEFVNNTLFN